MAATLSGVPSVSQIFGDVVTVGGVGVGAFANPLVGTGKPVTVSGFVLAGADASNYGIVQPVGLSADILPVTPAGPANTPPSREMPPDVARKCFAATDNVAGANCQNDPMKVTRPVSSTPTAPPTRIVDGGVRLPAGRLDGN